MTREENDLIRFGSTGMVNFGNDFASELSCPRCHSVMVLLCKSTMPPMYEADCYQCGFTIRESDRKDAYKPLYQGEVSEIYNKKRKPYRGI